MWGLRAATMAVRRSAVSRAGAMRAVHVEATKSSVQAAIKSEKVLVFSKTYCPYCARVKALFEDLDVDHEVVELDERPDGSDIQEILLSLTKQRTVPNVFIKGQHVGGCDAVTELYAQKKLQAMLE
ncbi:hypothetical protein P43SY_006818 [Pythium insidiosum]|uniref:Glutaredoxin domain-containing protein n=1 Tax=Pythium insidiosum TaxID=114742 RepID=A0AAD5LIY0_PYTIN|nr:hypothetical protein P43SY_006818 [Pythium insidiosum]